MNKLMTALSASVFLCLSSFSPLWADGWGNTTWGMDIPQVEMATKSKVTFNEKQNSHKLQDDISIGQYNFSVSLKFTNGKLDKVTLAAYESGKDYDVYSFLLDELKKKYGPPSVGPTEKRDRFSIMNDAEWVTKETVIKLNNFFMSLSGKTYKGTTVDYSPRQSASSGNL